MLKTIDGLLVHIEDVQKDVVELSTASLMKMSAYMEKNGLDIDDDMATALQYQDIITQQLNATIEAIEAVHTTISNRDERVQSKDEFENHLEMILKEAQEKKSRFSGQTGESHSDETVEFF